MALSTTTLGVRHCNLPLKEHTGHSMLKIVTDQFISLDGTTGPLCGCVLKVMGQGVRSRDEKCSFSVTGAVH